MITYEEASKLLRYDPDTGNLYWLQAPRGHKVGVAGSVDKKRNRTQVGVNGRRYLASRIAWLLTYKRWPHAEIDHANGNTMDNRLANLREATRSQNLANRLVSSNNKLGIKGVSVSREGTFRVAFNKDKKQIWIGTFKSLEDAQKAAREASVRIHGEFSGYLRAMR